MTIDDLYAHAGGLTWQAEGTCGQIGGDLWFPEKGGSVREAKAICRDCPVRTECLDYALTHRERWGVWGGLSEHERRKLAKRDGTGQVAA